MRGCLLHSSAGPVLAAGLLGAGIAPAQQREQYSRPVDRRFTFVEETLHGAPPGHFELENWVTWTRGTRANADLDRFDFKHELEFGLSAGVHAAIDLVEWHSSDERGEWHTSYDATGAELKFRLADPRTATLGAAFKTELGIGPRELEWENVLVLDKIVGRWDVAYNLALEFELESERSFQYEEGELGGFQALGVSYELTPALYVGGEVLHQIPKEWSWGERQSFLAGPNAAIRGNEWALTTTAMFLADGIADAPEFQLRFLFEVDS